MLYYNIARMRRGGTIASWIAALLLALAFPAAAAPKVVATIKPLYALAAQVMAGAGAPTLLIGGAGDPHDFQLRPSQAEALAEADLILWIGPSLESGLARPLQALARPGASRALAQWPELTLLPARAGLFGSGHAQAAERGQALDPHLWLDPDNARAIMTRLAAELGRLDPANARLYADNAFASNMRIGALADALATRLAPLAGRGYAIQHDALQYFERRFGLSPIGAIASAHDAPPGAAHMIALGRALAASKARCIFVQPQAAPGLAQALSRDTGARTAPLDDLGAGLEPGPDAYDQLLETIADALIACLR
jgi:zinc transport system substrate-binding protein